MATLTRLEIETALKRLVGWRLHPDREAIEKTFTFQTFNQAFAFMTSVALEAEKTDHHPEWSNVYTKVEVILTTHSAGGVTLKDIALAEFMEDCAT